MKLLPKLSLFTVVLVTLTALMTILFSINTIKTIIYDLNAQLVEKNLANVHRHISKEYDALEKHGLQDVKGYYEKVLSRIQESFNTRQKNWKGTLIILDHMGAEILHSGSNGVATDWDLVRRKHLSTLHRSIVAPSSLPLSSLQEETQTELDKTLLSQQGKIEFYDIKESNLVFFYKKIPQWNMGLFIILEDIELFHRLNDYIEDILKGFLSVLLIALVTGFSFSHYWVRRIKAALTQIQAIENGEMQARIKDIRGNDEITELKVGLNHMTEIIAERMFKQAKAELKAVKSQKSLQEQHALVNAFINAMPELAFILDEEGKYIEIFGSNNQLLYRQKELLLGKNLQTILPESVADQILRVIARTLETREPQITEYELTTSGTEKYFQGHTAVLDYELKNKTDKRMVVWIAHDLTEQVLAKQQAHRLSLFDPLTELPNRRLLMERLDQEIARAKRHEQLGALLFIDLDNFKIINDTCGHRTGDLLLKEAAKRLTSLLRKEDLACRLGGDEFVVLLSNLENNILIASSQAQTIAYKTLDILQVPYMLEGQQHQIGSSIGVVLFPEEQRDSHDLIKYADIAMYQAKEEGKNTVRLFARHMQSLLENRLQLQNDLRIALKENSLSIHLQPQYNELGHITSAEALVRWQHPDRGFISPVEFIPIAEESGLVHLLGRSVMAMVLHELQNILQLDLPASFKRIAINVSPWQFERKDYIDEVKALLNQYQIPAKYLELEITEQTLVGNFSAFSEKMKQMQDMGIRFSIDDFGTGYSSLSYLKSLPVNMLKIDRSFIRDITKDKNDDAIVDTIIVMAQHLGLEVIAEGVESMEQLEFLRAHNCTHYQGYYFSKPLPVKDFLALLLQQNN